MFADEVDKFLGLRNLAHTKKSRMPEFLHRSAKDGLVLVVEKVLRHL